MSTLEQIVLEDLTGAVTIPVGLPGVNSFSTSDWWSRATSTPESDGMQQHRIDQPGAAVVLASGQEAAEPPVVLMVTRPLVQWLPHTVADEAAADPTDKLVEWADAVLAWATQSPVQMVVARTDPENLSDLCAAAAGRWPVVEPDDHDLSPEAEAFGAVMQGWLQTRRRSDVDLDRFRSQAAIDAVAMATATPMGAYGDDLRRASIDVRERLTSAGVRIRGPRTGLVWPPQPGPDLPLDAAAEASLAVILAALDDPFTTPADLPGLQADMTLWEGRAETANQELSGRRMNPENLKRVRLRSLLKLMLLGATS